VKVLDCAGDCAKKVRALPTLSSGPYERETIKVPTRDPAANVEKVMDSEALATSKFCAGSKTSCVAMRGSTRIEGRVVDTTKAWILSTEAESAAGVSSDAMPDTVTFSSVTPLVKTTGFGLSVTAPLGKLNATETDEKGSAGVPRLTAMIMEFCM